MALPITGASAALAATNRAPPAAPRTAEAARKFQATILTELMRPLFPRLAPLGSMSSPSERGTRTRLISARASSVHATFVAPCRQVL